MLETDPSVLIKADTFTNEPNAPSLNPQVTLLRKLQQESWTTPSTHIVWPGRELPKALGSWDEGYLFLSGLENAGKSSLTSSTLTQVLELNPDVGLLHFSLDDSFRETTRRYVSTLAGVDTNMVARPINCTPKQKSLIARGYDQVAKWLEDGRLDIKTQAEDEANYAHKINECIEQFCQERPEVKPLVVIDAWHDIMLPEVKSDEPEKYVLQSIGRTLKQNKAIAIVTAHRRKVGPVDFSRRASNDELKGSAHLKYAAKVMLTVHNEVKARRENAEMYWTHPSNPLFRLPILEVSVQKNKTCMYDGTIYYYFEPSTGRLREVDEDRAEECRGIALESLNTRYRR